MDARQQWMAFLLQRALEYQLIAPDDVLRYATPRVIAGLPSDLKARVLKAGLTQGLFNAEVVVSVLTPEVLAANVPLPTLWGCIAEAGAHHFGGDVSHLTHGDVDPIGQTKPPAAPPAAASSAATAAAAAGAAGGAEPHSDLAVPPDGDFPFGDADSMFVIEEDGAEVSVVTEGEPGWVSNDSTGIDALSNLDNKPDEKGRPKRRATSNPSGR